MSLFAAFTFFSGHLIEIMGAVLMGVLTVRFVAYRAGKRDHMYFKTFSSSVNRVLEKERNVAEVKDVESWLDGILEKVIDLLPNRSVRNENKSSAKTGSFREGNIESFEGFAEGKKGLIHSVKQMTDTFKSPTPPSYPEMTDRVLREDRKWMTVMGVIPADTFARFLDILPGLFIVGGIFGTFVGITGALPAIANIDLSQLDQAGPVLNQFVESVAYSMRTSIAGICYSVILTLLNTFFPLATIRDEVQVHMESCFESIWLRLHGNELSSGEREMIRLLESIEKKSA